MLVVSLFCFHVSAHRLVLPSFPTRRSSDLGWDCDSGRNPCGSVGQTRVAAGFFTGSRRLWNSRRMFERANGHGAKGSGKTCRDRKSTRLNSSHTVISYAVFCLKKKKQARQE